MPTFLLWPTVTSLSSVELRCSFGKAFDLAMYLPVERVISTRASIALSSSSSSAFSSPSFSPASCLLIFLLSTESRLFTTHESEL